MTKLIPLGHFFFHYRNAVFPLLLLGAVLLAHPVHPLGNPMLDTALDLIGVLVALSGQTIRALTIGYDYIKRGGKNKQVYADRLVQGGMFALSRNPLYLGNGLILLGLALIINAPLFYVLAIPLTVLIYASIIAAEEQYLQQKFGAEFTDYCSRVNRLWPRWRDFPQAIDGMAFHWKRLLAKEHNTTFGWLLGAIAAKLWSESVIQGLGYWEHRQALILSGLLVLTGLAYALVHYLKKSGALAEKSPRAVDGYSPADVS